MTNEELIERLRNQLEFYNSGGRFIAADHLEALVKEKDQEYKDNIVRMAGQAKDFMEEISTLKFRIQRLETVIQDLLRYVPQDVVECRGDKCREPWCVSCYGWEEAKEGLDIATEVGSSARAVLKEDNHD